MSATASCRSLISQVPQQTWKHPSKESRSRVYSFKAPLQIASKGIEGPDDSSEEVAQRSQTPREKGEYFKTILVTGYLVNVLRPLLERLGLVVVKSSHGTAKASFAIISPTALADGAKANSILCLPVHVRVGHFEKSSGYTKFSKVKGHPGLVVLVEADDGLACSQPVTWDSPVAVYLFAGRSISIKTMNLTPATRSKYIPHRLGTYEALASVILEYARKAFDNKGGPLGDGCTVVTGGKELSVRDLLPLPTLEQMTSPGGEAHKRNMEAYFAFFGAEGLLAGPVMQALLRAEREDGSRSGRFMLKCKLEAGAVQLRASGRQAPLLPGRRVLLRTTFRQTDTSEPLLVDKVDISVGYTPCLALSLRRRPRGDKRLEHLSC